MPTITGSIPAAPKQKTVTTRTFWSALVAGLGFVIVGVTQFAPEVLPFISNPFWRGIITAIAGAAAAFAPLFSRSGAVDDAVYVAAQMDSAKAL